MSPFNPSSLFELAAQSVVRGKALAVKAPEDIPVKFFTFLFIEAYGQECGEALKFLVSNWPYRLLPMGNLMRQTTSSSFKAVLEGVDNLLAQNALSSWVLSSTQRRCKLQLLDLRDTYQGFWMQWLELRDNMHHSNMLPLSERCPRKETSGPLLEVSTDLYLHSRSPDELPSYLVKWAKDRDSIHVCYKTLSIATLSRPNLKFLSTISLCCISEVEIQFSWSCLALRRFARVLGRMKHLKRFIFSLQTPARPVPETAETKKQCVELFSAQFRKLHFLQDLYLESPCFLQDHLSLVLRRLSAPLRALSITNYVLSESDVIQLFENPYIIQLLVLCLRGVPLTSFIIPLRYLLESNARTLLYLDLTACNLLDSDLEALLPALVRCSQLSSIRLHSNRLSKDAVEKLLLCNTELQGLTVEV